MYGELSVLFYSVNEKKYVNVKEYGIIGVIEYVKDFFILEGVKILKD